MNEIRTLIDAYREAEKTYSGALVDAEEDKRRVAAAKSAWEKIVEIMLDQYPTGVHDHFHENLLEWRRISRMTVATLEEEIFSGAIREELRLLAVMLYLHTGVSKHGWNDLIFPNEAYKRFEIRYYHLVMTDPVYKFPKMGFFFEVTNLLTKSCGVMGLKNGEILSIQDWVKRTDEMLKARA